MLTGKEKQIKLFESMRSGHAVPHAMLFSGPAGVGKLDFAINLAYWLQGNDSKLREVNLNSIAVHPDIIIKKQAITIEEARSIKKDVRTSPYSGNHKIVILDQAERMREEAANSLLKTIEEPKGETIFILLTKNTSLILPTIKSRCYEIKFNYVADDVIRKNVNTKEIEDLHPHWSGRPSYAQMFSSDAALCSEVKKIKQDCDIFLKEGLAVRFNIIEKYVKIEDNSRDILWVLQIWMEHMRENNFNENLIRRLLKLHKNLATTNANAKYLLNNFAVQTCDLQ